MINLIHKVKNIMSLKLEEHLNKLIIVVFLFLLINLFYIFKRKNHKYS